MIRPAAIPNPKDFDPKYNPYLLVGVDEVGTGCVAGPVVVAACIVNPEEFWIIEHVNDSKKIKGKNARKTRAWYAKEIKDRAFDFALSSSSVGKVNRIGPRRSALKAMAAAVEEVCSRYDAEPQYDRELLIIVDGKARIPTERRQVTVVRADESFLAVAAASILAKAHRDAIMEEMGREYPGYGFEQHVGYGTPQHAEALSRLGLCPIHRKSMADRLRRTWRAKHPPPSS